MISNLKNIVSSVIGQRSNEVEKRVYRYQDFLNALEKEVDDEKITTKSEVMQKIRAKFSYHLSADEYRKIEKELGYKIK